MSARTPGDAVRFTTRRVDCIEGFRILGARISPRGAAQADALVKINGGPHVKRYSIRRRVGDGHTVYRWGRLVAAEVTESSDGGRPIVVFIPESYIDMRARFAAVRAKAERL